MCREIKFRAWDILNSRMYDVLKIDFERKHVTVFEKDRIGSYCTGLIELPFENVVLLEYTGIKDKKRTEEYPEGQEIWEGDTLMAASYMCYVTWCDKKAAWAVIYPESFANSEQKSLLSNYRHDIHLDVIGNVHEKNYWRNHAIQTRL